MRCDVKWRFPGYHFKACKSSMRANVILQLQALRIVAEPTYVATSIVRTFVMFCQPDRRFYAWPVVECVSSCVRTTYQRRSHQRGAVLCVYASHRNWKRRCDRYRHRRVDLRSISNELISTDLLLCTSAYVWSRWVMSVCAFVRLWGCAYICCFCTVIMTMGLWRAYVSVCRVWYNECASLRGSVRCTAFIPLDIVKSHMLIPLVERSPTSLWLICLIRARISYRHRGQRTPQHSAAAAAAALVV